VFTDAAPPLRPEHKVSGVQNAPVTGEELHDLGHAGSVPHQSAKARVTQRHHSNRKEIPASQPTFEVGWAINPLRHQSASDEDLCVGLPKTSKARTERTPHREIDEGNAAACQKGLQSGQLLGSGC